MRLGEYFKKLSITNLPLRNRMIISFGVSSMIPLLIMVYLLLPTITPELSGSLKNHSFLNMDIVLLLVICLAVLGLASNLSIAKGAKRLVEKTREIQPEITFEDDQDLNEIDQVSKNISIIVKEMQEKMGQLSQFDKNLITVKKQLKGSKMELKKLAVKDELTGLFNRRYFNRKLEDELQRAKRYNRPVALMMTDLDNFKSVNDNYGHPAGDLVLTEFAGLLQNGFREVDTVARYGGEEFVVILPETELENAKMLADRVRKKVEDHTFVIDDGTKLRMSVSIGVSAQQGLDEEGGDIVKEADIALYKAKEKGKNRVVIYSQKNQIKATG